MSEKGAIMHPTIAEQLARAAQFDRLERAARARLVHEACVQEQGGDRGSATIRERLRRLFAAAVA